MKKLYAIFIMAVFILSMVPASFAEEDNGEDLDVTIDGNRIKMDKDKVRIQTADGQDIRAKFRDEDGKLRERIEVRSGNRTIAQFKTSEAFARIQERNPEFAQRMEQFNSQQSEVFQKLSRAQREKVVGMSEDEIKEELSKYKVKTVKVEDYGKKREVSKEKMEASKEKYEAAREKYQERKEAAQEKREKFMEGKEKLAECEGDESEECETLRNNVQENAKGFVFDSAEKIISHLEQLLSKIESSEEMDPETAEEMIADINEKIDAIKALIEDSESVDTKQELQKIAKEINAEWRKIEHKERAYTARVVNAKIYMILKKTELLEKRLEKTLDKMDEKGIDTTDLQDKLDDFSALVDEAKEKYEEAKAKIDEAKDSEDKEEAKSLATEAREIIKEAHEKIKEAHMVLVEIIKGVKASGEDIVEEEDEVDEVEEEDDTTTTTEEVTTTTEEESTTTEEEVTTTEEETTTTEEEATTTTEEVTTTEEATTTTEEATTTTEAATTTEEVTTTTVA